jgi:catechol-2,3-dioxygenase
LNTSYQQHSYSILAINMSSDNPTIPLRSKPETAFTLHHLKLASASLQETYDFYTQVLPFTAMPSLNHYTPSGTLYGAIFALPQPTPSSDPKNTPQLLVEIRQHAAQATAQRGWDPITWGVPRRADLEAWRAWFEDRGVKHSRILKGVLGWVLGVEDPDGRIVKLYTTEEAHEWTADVDDGEIYSWSCGSFSFACLLKK